MALGLFAFLSDDVTPATSIAFDAVTGIATSTTRVDLWKDPGIPGGEEHGIKLWPEVEFPVGSGIWVSSGHPAIDQGWFQVKIAGGSGPASEPRFVPPSGGAYRVVKPSKPFEIGSLYGNCKIALDVRVTVRRGAAGGSFNWRFRPTSDYVFQTTDPNLPCGILRGLNDTSRFEFIVAPVITATGTPDSHVHGTFHSSNWFGVYRARVVQDDLTLNQTDGLGGSLTTGQAYKALVYRTIDHSTALSVLKGTRAVSASAGIPTLPAGALPVAVVHVAYGASGSVITSGNITNLAVDGWGSVKAGTGLQAIVGRLRAQMPGTLVEVNKQQTVALTASSTNRLWANSDGTLSAVTTGDDAPYLGSEHLADLVTDGSGVTSIVDRRRFEDSQGEWREMKKLGSETASTGKDSTMIPYAHQVVAVVAAVGIPSSGGATGSSTFDINRRRAGTATTIFTNQGGSTETRPTIAAGGSTSTAALPEVTADGNAGDSYVLDQDAATSGGTQATDVYALMLVYRRP